MNFFCSVPGSLARIPKMGSEERKGDGTQALQCPRGSAARRGRGQPSWGLSRCPGQGLCCGVPYDPQKEREAEDPPHQHTQAVTALRSGQTTPQALSPGLSSPMQHSCHPISARAVTVPVDSHMEEAKAVGTAGESLGWAQLVHTLHPTSHCSLERKNREPGDGTLTHDCGRQGLGLYGPTLCEALLNLLDQVDINLECPSTLSEGHSRLRDRVTQCCSGSEAPGNQQGRMRDQHPTPQDSRQVREQMQGSHSLPKRTHTPTPTRGGALQTPTPLGS